MFRRRSFNNPSKDAINLAEDVMAAAKEYRKRYPEKSLFHSSQDAAQHLYEFALEAKNRMHAENMITMLPIVVNFLDKLETHIEILKNEHKTTLLGLLMDPTLRFEENFNYAIKAYLPNTPYQSRREGIDKMKAELEIILGMTATQNKI